MSPFTLLEGSGAPALLAPVHAMGLRERKKCRGARNRNVQ